MKGIQYLVDGKNRKKAVVIDYKTLLEHQGKLIDLLDVIIADSLRDEPKKEWKAVKKKVGRKSRP